MTKRTELLFVACGCAIVGLGCAPHAGSAPASAAASRNADAGTITARPTASGSNANSASGARMGSMVVAGSGGAQGATVSRAADAGSTRNAALPCDVASVIARRCQSCHAAPPRAGVPMSLMSWSDFQAPAVSRPDLSVHELAATRVHDSAKPMPPGGMLPAAELATLDAWLGGGASASDVQCASGGPDVPPAGPPPDSTCYTLLAHGAQQAKDTSPWMVDAEHYACFYFDMPWPEGAQGVYFAPVFDAHPEIVHHFVFYLDESGNQPDGYVETCSGLHPSSPTMVAGWAPGSDNNALPADVGLLLSPSNHKLLLEMHFFHDGTTAAIPTRSGAKICTANTPRPNTATISLLGTEAIALAPHASGTASGTCTPEITQDVHILRSWPHMHQMGRGMQTVIMRGDGTTELLGSWPFDFNSQVSYPTAVTIHPGDRLTTTCNYDNTSDNVVATGVDTQSEMCFNFVTAYPAKALASHNILGGSTSATSSATACLQ
jgi:hypothetical protein